MGVKCVVKASEVRCVRKWRGSGFMRCAGGRRVSKCTPQSIFDSIFLLLNLDWILRPPNGHRKK